MFSLSELSALYLDRSLFLRRGSFFSPGLSIYCRIVSIGAPPALSRQELQQSVVGTFTGIDEFTAFRLWLCAEHHMNMVCIVIPFFQYDPVSGCDILKDLFCSFGYFVIQYFSSVFYNQGDNIAEILNWNYGLILLYLSLFFLYRLICIYELIVLFQYTISGDREQVFLWYYKDFFEQICSDVQFISPPEGRH